MSYIAQKSDVMEDQKNLWWGYVHVDGGIQVKRFFDRRDIDDAFESPFVAQVIQPFPADTRDEALAYIKAHAK